MSTDAMITPDADNTRRTVMQRYHQLLGRIRQDRARLRTAMYRFWDLAEAVLPTMGGSDQPWTQYLSSIPAEDKEGAMAHLMMQGTPAKAVRAAAKTMDERCMITIAATQKVDRWAGRLRQWSDQVQTIRESYLERIGRREAIAPPRQTWLHATEWVRGTIRQHESAPTEIDALQAVVAQRPGRKKWASEVVEDATWALFFDLSRGGPYPGGTGERPDLTSPIARRQRPLSN
jgi:hypothetical protein